MEIITNIIVNAPGGTQNFDCVLFTLVFEVHEQVLFFDTSHKNIEELGPFGFGTTHHVGEHGVHEWAEDAFATFADLVGRLGNDILELVDNLGTVTARIILGGKLATKSGHADWTKHLEDANWDLGIDGNERVILWSSTGVLHMSRKGIHRFFEVGGEIHVTQVPVVD